MVKAELSQQGKLSAIDYLQAAKGDRSRLCFVGDGIHDNELMQRADLGIAMNALRAENAMESADFAVLGNNIMTLAVLMKVCVSAYRIAWTNTFFMAAVKLILLILAVTGVLPLLVAAIIELISTGLLMFYALSAYGIRR
jgi:Cd2+/Zn2+-exporting ATPase